MTGIRRVIHLRMPYADRRREMLCGEIYTKGEPLSE